MKDYITPKERLSFPNLWKGVFIDVAGFIVVLSIFIVGSSYV